MRVYMIIGDVEIPTSPFTPEVKEKKTKALGFVRSEIQAKKGISHIKEYTENIENIRYEKEDIPTDKDGFVSWLNDFCYDGQNMRELIEEILEGL